MGEPDVAPERRRQQPLPAGRLTFLFTDIEGSTRLFRELGHEYVVVLDRQRSILRAAVKQANGVEISTSGDEVFAVFSSADDAAEACISAQRQLAEEQWPHGRPVRIRMGLHTGDAAPFGGDYVSLVVHQAARVSAAAHGGQVLLSDATSASLTRHPSRLLGSFLLRDFPEAEQLHQLDVPGSDDRFPSPRTRSAVVSHLPGRASSFVGREGEIESLCAELSGGRMVTLVGVGGTGKTRLAVEAAERVAALAEGGAHLVELAPVREAWAIPAAIAAALGLTLPTSEDAVGSLVALASDLDALLVLDNCEHLLEPVAELADALVRRSRLRILATSRAPLRIDGERVVPVEPLPPDDAAALLVARARASGADLADDEGTQAAAHEIARLLDGMPLAIELVAVQLSEVPLAQIVEGLSRGELGLGSRRGGDPRQRSLESTIAWSWDLLDADGQAAWRRLAVLRNGAAPELAVEVVAFGALGTQAAESAVGHLVEHSVLSPVSGAPGRYRLLEPLREHALARLEPAEAEEALAQLRRALASRLPLDRTAVVPLMSAHRDDLIAAVQHRPVDDSSLALARATAYSTVFGLLAEEGLQLAESVVADSGAAPPPALSRALAGGYRHLGQLGPARRTVELALLGTPTNEERALLESALGDVQFYGGHPTLAREHQQRAITLLPASASAQRAFITMRLAEIQLVLGDAAGGLRLLRGIEAELVGDHAHCVLLHDLAQAMVSLGDYDGVRGMHKLLQEQGDAANREALLCAHMVAAELAEMTGDLLSGLAATERLIDAARGETRPLDIVWHSTLRSRALLMAGDGHLREAAAQSERGLRAALAMTQGTSAQLITPLASLAAYWPDERTSRSAFEMTHGWTPTYGMLWTHRDLQVAHKRHGAVTPRDQVTEDAIHVLIASLRAAG